MMSGPRFLFLALVLVLLHLIFFQYLSSDKVFPDLFLVLVVFAALQWGPMAGALAGFICGLAQDSFSFTYFGLQALSKTVIGFTLGKIRQSFYSNNYLVLLIIVLAAKTIHDLLYFGVYFSGELGSFWHQILIYTPLSAVYTCVLGVAIYFLINFKIRITSG